MALKILQHNNTFYAHGKINSSTLRAFREYMEVITEHSKFLNLNIDAVQEIDKSGIEALKEIYVNALRYNKDFVITGYGCKEVYDEFRFENVA